MTDQDRFKKYKKLTEDIRECMLVTDDAEIGIHARPMYLAACDDAGKLWFFTDISDKKVQEIYHDHTVCCAFAKPSDKDYVSATGQASIERDLAKKKQYYHKMHDAWFDGPEDPKASLICVHVHHAEYWNDNDSSIITMAKIAATAVFGGEDANYQGTENEKLTL